MSALRINMRVKKVHGVDAGNTGVILSFLDYHNTPCAEVRWDKAGQCCDGTMLGSMFPFQQPAGHVAAVPCSTLEPILPEGQKPSEFTTLQDLKDSLSRQFEAIQ